MRHSTRHSGGRKWPAGLLAVPFLALALSGILGGAALAGNQHAKQPVTTTTTATGVKPSSTSKHHTTADAGSGNTKKYGNGQTAGEIAIKHGASTTTPLHGPGNSQPHKVATCPKKGKSHEVDVHAKKYSATTCATSTTTTPATTTDMTTTHTTTTTTTTTHTTRTGTTPNGTTGTAPNGTNGTTAPSSGQSRTGALGATSTKTPATAAGVHGASKTLVRKRGGGKTRASSPEVAAPAHAVPGSAHFTG